MYGKDENECRSIRGIGFSMWKVQTLVSKLTIFFITVAHLVEAQRYKP
jgi:hypothetical protein